MYREIKERLEEIISGENNFITNAANFSALIFSSLKDINWVGFYLLATDELILGPFQGKPACMRIAYGRGVCGTAVKLGTSVVVEDVHKFPGHIPCDPLSKSEIVVPLKHKNKLYGVLDIDSPVTDRFNEKDRAAFEDLINTLVECSDMESLSRYYNH